MEIARRKILRNYCLVMGSMKETMNDISNHKIKYRDGGGKYKFIFQIACNKVISTFRRTHSDEGF